MFEKFLAQIHLLRAVWIPFALALAFLALVIWKIVDWHYQGIIATLRERITLRDERVADDVRNQLEAMPPIAPAATASPEGPKAPREPPSRADMLILVNRTLSNARSALGERHTAGYVRALPSLKSTLISLEKAYSVRIPDLSKLPAKEALEGGIRFVDDVWPYLKQGHELEARQLAATLKEEIERGKGG